MKHNKWLNSLLRADIMAMEAYHVQPSQGLVKLDVMENPYDFSTSLKNAWVEKLKRVEVNRYPDPLAQNLKHALLEQSGLPGDFDVMFGNGSDELIQILIQSLSAGAGPVLSVSPSFVMFGVLSKIVGREYIEVPLKSDFSLDETAIQKELKRRQPACIFLAYPNNPTGNLFDEQKVRHLIESAPGLVVIDEAYMPFAGATLIDWLNDFPNLLVMRTMSKSGLAGLRFGMLYGHQSWLNEFNKIRLPFNINSLTQASVEFAMDNSDFFQDNAQKIVEERDRLITILESFSDLDVFPSDANFILFRTKRLHARRVFEELLARNILIKCVHKPDSLLEQCLRVTIGTQQENDFFLDCMADILKVYQ